MNVSEVTRSDRKKLAVEMLKRFKYLPAYIHAFENEDKVGTSEPKGFVYWANDDQRKTVSELEDEGKTVYAIIHGIYRVGTPQVSETMEMTSYLFISNEDVVRAGQNREDGLDQLEYLCEDRHDKYGFTVYAYVVGWDDEFGNICVKGCNGGLTRTA